MVWTLLRFVFTPYFSRSSIQNSCACERRSSKSSSDISTTARPAGSVTGFHSKGLTLSCTKVKNIFTPSRAESKNRTPALPATVLSIWERISLISPRLWWHYSMKWRTLFEKKRTGTYSQKKIGQHYTHIGMYTIETHTHTNTHWPWLCWYFKIPAIFIPFILQQFINTCKFVLLKNDTSYFLSFYSYISYNGHRRLHVILWNKHFSTENHINNYTLKKKKNLF